jgi:ABC-type uncharacterized transport system permease subunit
MENSQEQQSGVKTTGVRVAAFEQPAKQEILEIFLKGREQVQTELRVNAICLVRWAVAVVGGLFGLATAVFLGWSMGRGAAPEPERIVACLVAIGILLIAFLGVLLALAKVTRSGSD